MSAAIRDLDTLLAQLDVKQQPGVWRFETFPAQPNFSAAIMAFREAEGWTAILPVEDATSPDNRWAWLTLTVQSDLNAVGFLAITSSRLAEAGVPCNAVAGYHHDHIFVPEEMAETAIAAITQSAS